MANGVARSGFDVDLAFGEARESAFVSAIMAAHVECKSDQKAKKTGNVAIEIRQGSVEAGKGRRSGIGVTTSRWWAIEVEDDRWVLIRTSLLKEIVLDVFAQRGSVMGGDGNRFELVLVPRERLIKPVVHAAVEVKTHVTILGPLPTAEEIEDMRRAFGEIP